MPYAVHKACLCNRARSCGCDCKPTSSRVMQDGAQECRAQLRSGQVGCNWQPLCCVSPCAELCVCLVLFPPHIGTVCELRVIPHNRCQCSAAALTGTLTEPSPNLRRWLAGRGVGVIPSRHTAKWEPEGSQTGLAVAHNQNRNNTRQTLGVFATVHVRLRFDAAFTEK